MSLRAGYHSGRSPGVREYLHFQNKIKATVTISDRATDRGLFPQLDHRRDILDGKIVRAINDELWYQSINAKMERSIKSSENKTGQSHDMKARRLRWAEHVPRRIS
ncbi:unnamed protein product [Nezara viridula]|uniref:Uncharacterized protein n=1 Tax=Nezara viridula TaxID=85310 RepID=A0A9P0MSA1_NEZVI|nr:unnamed protein product [Nezara viridula]